MGLDQVVAHRHDLRGRQRRGRVRVDQRSLVYQAALLDPNTAATLTTQQIVAMCDDLIEAHGALMPEGIRHDS